MRRSKPMFAELVLRPNVSLFFLIMVLTAQSWWLSFRGSSHRRSLDTVNGRAANRVAGRSDPDRLPYWTADGATETSLIVHPSSISAPIGAELKGIALGRKTRPSAQAAPGRYVGVGVRVANAMTNIYLK